MDQQLIVNTCDRCGEALHRGDEFCGACGYPVTNTGEGTPTAGQVVVGRRLSGAARFAPAPSEQSLATQNGHASDGELPRTVSAAMRPRRRKRRRSRPWYRRPLLVVPLAILIVFLAGAAIAFQRLGSTMSTVQSVSTPPAQVEVAIAEEDFVASGGDVTNEALPVVQIDTEPAVEAVRESEANGHQGYDDESDGLLGSVRSTASDTADLSRGAASAAGVGDDEIPALTILLMGVDARPGEAIDMGVRPDVLMVVRLDPTTKTCRALSIPRDTRVELPGYGESKVNHALMIGGIPYQLLVTEKFLGIEIDRYALIDFAGFKDLVDAVGEVEVNVPTQIDFQGITIPTGPQVLNGDEALAYARLRDAPDGDLGRIKRQWALLKGLGQKLSGRDVPTEINRLLPALKDHLRTNLSPADLVEISNGYADRCSADTVEPVMLDGDHGLLSDPFFDFPLYFIVVPEATVQERVAELMNG